MFNQPLECLGRKGMPTALPRLILGMRAVLSRIGLLSLGLRPDIYMHICEYVHSEGW